MINYVLTLGHHLDDGASIPDGLFYGYDSDHIAFFHSDDTMPMVIIFQEGRKMEWYVYFPSYVGTPKPPLYYLYMEDGIEFADVPNRAEQVLNQYERVIKHGTS